LEVSLGHSVHPEQWSPGAVLGPYIQAVEKKKGTEISSRFCRFHYGSYQVGRCLQDQKQKCQQVKTISEGGKKKAVLQCIKNARKDFGSGCLSNKSP